MTRVIYADVFFLVNFSMDFLSLDLTARLHHRNAKLVRRVLGAALGGLYALVALFLSPTAEAPLTLFFPIVMILVTFGYGGLGRLIKYALTLFAVSFALGGVMTAAYYLLGRLLSAKGILLGGSVETLYSDLPLPILGLLALAAAAISALSLRFAAKSGRAKVCQVILSEGDRHVSVTALCDSGNLVEDPITHLPVIVVSRAVLEALLPPTLAEALLAPEITLDRLQGECLCRVRLIPVTTVGGGCLLRGIIPEAVEIGGERKRACIAFDPADSFGEYDGILPAELL